MLPPRGGGCRRMGSGPGTFPGSDLAVLGLWPATGRGGLASFHLGWVRILLCCQGWALSLAGGTAAGTRPRAPPEPSLQAAMGKLRHGSGGAAGLWQCRGCVGPGQVVLAQQPAAPWGQDEFTGARSVGHGPIPPGPDISPKGTNTFGATAAVPPGQEQTNSGKFSLLSHGKSWGRPHPSAVSHRHALPAAPHGDGDGVRDGDRVTTPPPPQRPPQGTAAEPVVVLPCRAGATRHPQPHRPPHAACCNPWPHPSPGISAAQPGLASEGQEGGGGSGRRAADVEPGSLGRRVPELPPLVGISLRLEPGMGQVAVAPCTKG